MSSALDNNYKVIHIDYASYLDGAWYMSGWLVSEADMPVISVSIEDEDNALVKVFYEFFERDDLITALNLPDTVNAYGFTLVAERSESDFTKLVFKIDNKEIVASSLEPVIIDSPDVILAALGAKKASFCAKYKKGSIIPLIPAINQQSPHQFVITSTYVLLLIQIYFTLMAGP
ncbi:hypothetical protein P4S66_18215 [Pseudoalteromonas sp. B129b]